MRGRERSAGPTGARRSEARGHRFGGAAALALPDSSTARSIASSARGGSPSLAPSSPAALAVRRRPQAGQVSRRFRRRVSSPTISMWGPSWGSPARADDRHSRGSHRVIDGGPAVVGEGDQVERARTNREGPAADVPRARRAARLEPHFKPLTERLLLRPYKSPSTSRHRPHQGLDGRTPDEVFSGRRRKKPSGKLLDLSLGHLSGDARLPVYRRKLAA